MIDDTWLTRKEAARFLTSIGHPITAKTLANLASMRIGPEYERRGWKFVLYERRHLEAWAERRVERERMEINRVSYMPDLRRLT